MAKSLFITYDGLTDTLGQSQILPYLEGLSRKGHEIHILSCEKPLQFQKNRHLITSICRKSDIVWHSLKFRKALPIISKYYDLYQLTRYASRLHKREKFDIIHCRSYLSAEIGLKLKQETGVKFLFDMRGFWVDERIDGGLWNKERLIYRVAYRSWKKKEASFIRHADQIISLTEAGQKEIRRWDAYQNAPIEVIPCSADLGLFTPTDEFQKQESRKLLQIEKSAFVLGYLGSIGTWYLLNEMLQLFKEIKKRREDARFLILSPDDPNRVYSLLPAFNLSEDDVIIRFAARKEVPLFMKASDYCVSFIKPAYSKIASSPTKLGELLAMNIPVICNDIGDVRAIIDRTKGGVVIDEFSSETLSDFVIKAILCLKRPQIDKKAVSEYYSLEKAIQKYHCIYQNLTNS